MIYYITVRLDTRRADPNLIRIGNKGDHNCTTVQFVLPEFLQNETVNLVLRVRNFEDIILLPADRKWTLTRDYTQYAGNWTAYLKCDLKNGAHWSSDPFTFAVSDTPDDGGERLKKQYPTAIDEALKAADALIHADVSAQTLPAGSEATAQVVTGTDGGLVITYGIPQGKPGYTPRKGIDYSDGEPGYTPQKGTDYWTSEDIAQIKSYVDDAILNGRW